MIYLNLFLSLQVLIYYNNYNNYANFNLLDIFPDKHFFGNSTPMNKNPIINYDNYSNLALSQFSFTINSTNSSGLTSHGSQSAYNLNQYREKSEFYETKYKDLVNNFNMMKNFLEELENFYLELFKICHSK